MSTVSIYRVHMQLSTGSRNGTKLMLAPVTIHMYTGVEIVITVAFAVFLTEKTSVQVPNNIRSPT